MARKSDAVYTNYPLPEGSNALSDLDAFCEEWGNNSRADATQRLVIAWAKARRGDFSAFGAMGIALAAVAAPTATVEPTPPVAPPEPKSMKRSLNGNASKVELDL